LGQDAEVAKMVEHVVTLGMRRIAVVSWNDPNSLDVLNLVIAEAAKHKLEIIVRPTVEAGTAKVEGAVAECLKAKPNVIIAVLPVHATGAFVKRMREANDFTPIYGASYTESGLLAQFAGAENARGVGITQVVPNPFGGSIKLVKEYQESMRRYAPNDTRYSTLSFEGFIAAKILVEAMRSAGPNINGTTVKTALEKLRSLDLGGLNVSYDSEQHVGLTYLDISVVGPEGRLLY
jgi:ABC-type branched-subunit amino acid transport system substrate-binding protein